MWFILLGIALVLLICSGIYFRRRLVSALGTLGVREQTTGWVGRGVLWLLFGYPIIVAISIVGSIVLGAEISRAPGVYITWLLALPFWISVLVVLQTMPFLLVFDLITRVTRNQIEQRKQLRIRSWAIIAVPLFFVLYTPVHIILNADALEVHRHSIGTSQAKPFRIVFLGDLQQDRNTDQKRVDQVIALANEEQSDLILAGGDWINMGANYIEIAAASAGRLQSRLGTLSVRGDHEHFAYRDQSRSVSEITAALAQNRVELIDNQVRWFEHNGKRIAILLLSYNYIYRTADDQIRNLVAELQGADYSIMVSHQFGSHLAELVRDRVDLVLAAHTHGGQVNPVLGFVHVPLARVETEYVKGRYALGHSTTVIVTSGIGFSLAPFRYASPASIEVIELRL